MDLSTMLQIVLFVDGIFAIYFMFWIMVSGEGKAKLGFKSKDGEDQIRGEVGKDIFSCPYGHHFLRDEAVMFIDNMNQELRIYCPKCWEKGRRVLVAREKTGTPVIMNQPQAPPPREEAVIEPRPDVMKAFDDFNVRLKKLEEALNSLALKLEKLERSETETITIEDEATGETWEEPVEEKPKKRRRRKK